MIQVTQQSILRNLAVLCEPSPDIRVGQLLAHLGFLAEDRYERTLWEIDDVELLQILEQHRTELMGLQSTTLESSVSTWFPPTNSRAA